VRGREGWRKVEREREREYERERERERERGTKQKSLRIFQAHDEWVEG